MQGEPRGPDAVEPDPGNALFYRWVLGALAVVAFAASLIIYRTIFPLYTNDLDEGVYVLQAHMILNGQISLPLHQYGQLLRPWLTGRADGRIFTEFQVGLPLLLAGSLFIFGTPRIGLAAVMASAVVAMYGFAFELLYSQRVALVASGVLLLSPIFLVQSGLVLTYPLSLAAMLTAGWAMLRGVRTGSFPMLLCGGGAFGVMALTRPSDVVLAAPPLLLLAACRATRGGRSRRAAFGRVGMAFFAGVAPAAVITLWYNWMATGSALSFPNMAADPRNTFGFGFRRLMVGQPLLNYSFADARWSLEHNLAAVPSWLFGGGVSCVLALYGAFRLMSSQRRTEAVTLTVIAVAFPAGYLFWWATLLSARAVTNGLGPDYYIPSFAPLAILAAVGIDDLVGRVRRHRRTVALGVAALLVGITGWAVPGKLSANLNVTRNFQRIDAAIPPHLIDALVFVNGSRYLLNPYPFLQTQPDLNGPVIYAPNLGAADARLVARFPDRHDYLLEDVYVPGDGVLTPNGQLIPMRVETGQFLRLTMTPTAVAAGGHARAYLQIGKRFYFSPLRRSDGRYGDVSWRIGPSGPASPGSREIPASLPANVHQVSIGIETATNPEFDRPEFRTVRLAVAALHGRLTAIAPGVGWEYLQFPRGAAWLRTGTAPGLRVSVQTSSER